MLTNYASIVIEMLKSCRKTTENKISLLEMSTSNEDQDKAVIDERVAYESAFIFLTNRLPSKEELNSIINKD